MTVNIHESAPAKPHTSLSTGKVISMLSELKEWTQEELAEKSRISPKNLSGLENGRVDIGKRRAEQLAKAFNIHPAIIMFPEYETSGTLKAA